MTRHPRPQLERDAARPARLPLPAAAPPAPGGADRRGVPLGAGPGSVEHPARAAPRPRRPRSAAGDLQRDDAPDEPDPAPVTTIAWRIAHITVECLAMRTMNHFDGPPAHWETWEYTATRRPRRWPSSTRRTTRGRPGCERLGEEGLARPVRTSRGSLGRVAVRRPGAPHQPRADPPRRGDLPAPRPLPRHPRPRGDLMSRTVQVTFDCRRPDRAVALRRLRRARARRRQGRGDATGCPTSTGPSVLRFVEMHANSELMGVLPEREWIMRAPTLKRKLALTAKVQDECRPRPAALSRGGGPRQAARGDVSRTCSTARPSSTTSSTTRRSRGPTSASSPGSSTRRRSSPSRRCATRATARTAGR